ncbi:MAG: ATP-binding cassette domain-containing protein [Bacteroidetes bacterium]|nr:ATP-binding cassette domain-containing protein [Bacteroidota bacterium]
MEEKLFTVTGLKCGYKNKRKNKTDKLKCPPVLLVDSLIIPSGKITIFLGKSGSGKSTFLETLGLMSNTFLAGSISFEPEAISIDSKTWEKPQKLAKIRNMNFSFVFQHDYLMPYYSSIENMIISLLIQKEKVGKEETQKKILELCKSLGLDPLIIDEKEPYEMAGGQKQRLSFLRALMKDYIVLFGDEPTGNLDIENSDFLMKQVVHEIHESNSGENKSAIIVSHNIELSIKYGDCIVVLTKCKHPDQGSSNGPYEILPENVLKKENGKWKHPDQGSSNGPYEILPENVLNKENGKWKLNNDEISKEDLIDHIKNIL